MLGVCVGVWLLIRRRTEEVGRVGKKWREGNEVALEEGGR